MNYCRSRLWGLSVLLLLTFEVYSQQDDNLKQLEKLIIEAREKGRLSDAEQLADELLQQAKVQDAPVAQADGLYQMGRLSMERNQYPQAQALLNQAIEIYQDQGQQVRLGQTYRQLGLTYRYQSNYPTALEYVYLSMQIFQQTDDLESIGAAYNSIGVILEKMGQYEEAAQAHQNALEINHEMSDDVGVASALYNLGDIRRSMGDNELALKYFNDALKLDIESGNKKNIAYSHLKIGTVHNDTANYADARKHINEALTLFREIETPRDTDWALSVLAHLELNEGNLTEANAIITGVIQRAIDGQYKSLLVDAYEVAALVAIELQNFDQALEYVEAGLAQASDNGELASEADFEALRVKIHLATDSLKQAFQALQRQKQLDDTIINEKRLDSIARVQAQTEFVRRAHQIELLEKEKALQNALVERQKLSRNFWLIVVVAFSILLILLYGRFIQHRVNRKLEKQVSLRTKELEVKNQELAKAYRDMEAISLTDKLTGIHNRRFLENHISADLEQCNRVYQDWLHGRSSKPVQSDIAIFICDLDNFKQVNDKFGHNAGDRVLKQFAQRMAKVFRHSDYLVRWGGEEFVAIARFIERVDAQVLAQRMQEAVTEQVFELTDEKSAFQTCSIGFACCPLLLQKGQQPSWQSIIALADACLYEVKTSGKNSWMGVQQVNDPNVFKQDISHANLSHMIENQQLMINQPGQKTLSNLVI